MNNIVINGRPISKKNSKQIYKVGGRTIVASSKAYKKFESDALNQLGESKNTIVNLCTVDYTFYIKGKYHVDLDNLIAGINDILQKAKIIKDDDLISTINARKIGGCGGWSTKISIIEN